jgi:hypothetical protein
VQILNWFCEKRSRYVWVLLFLEVTFIWVTSSECRRTKEFANPRVDLILIWDVQ